jgi:hypothetical protein
MFLVGSSLFIIIWGLTQGRFQGVIEEFQIPKLADKSRDEYKPAWLFANGMFGMVLSFGLLWTALKSRKARSWRYGTGRESF